MNYNIHSDQKNEVFCKKCSNLICFKCSILEHKNHDLQELKIAEKSLKISLTEKIKNQSKIKEDLKGFSETFRSMRQSQKIFLQDYKNEIDMLNNLMTILENKKNKLAQNLKKVRKEQKLNIKLQQNEIDFITNTLKLYEQSLDKIENINHLKKIHSDVDGLKTKFDNFKSQLDNMKIMKVNSFQSEVKTIQTKIELLQIKISDIKISDHKIIDNKIVENKILYEKPIINKIYN